MVRMSAQCIILNRNLVHFSPIHIDTFAPTSLQIRGSEFGKTNIYIFPTIPGHLVILEMVHFSDIRDSKFYQTLHEKENT